MVKLLWGLAGFFVAVMCRGLIVSWGQETAVFVNLDTGYEVFIEDRAELLTKEQRIELSEVMEEITAYGNAGFVTTNDNPFSTENFARDYYRNRFGTDSGTVFVMDMANRNIWIHSDGAVYKVITDAYGNTVTDNVYKYASRGDYYGCAKEAFSEIHTLLKGQRIPQPMKYISNGLLALILALLFNYGLVVWFTRLKAPKTDAVLSNIHRKFGYSNLRATYTHQTRIYDPVSRGSGGSSGGGGNRSGGRSGGGGGGRSGGGGGHSF